MARRSGEQEHDEESARCLVEQEQEQEQEHGEGRAQRLKQGGCSAYQQGSAVQVLVTPIPQTKHTEKSLRKGKKRKKKEKKNTKHKREGKNKTERRSGPVARNGGRN